LTQKDGLRHVGQENEKRVVADMEKAGEEDGRSADFRYEDVRPEKPPVYRGGAAAEQGFCTLHKPLRLTSVAVKIAPNRFQLEPATSSSAA
jgi:hypothetical protein